MSLRELDRACSSFACRGPAVPVSARAAAPELSSRTAPPSPASGHRSAPNTPTGVRRRLSGAQGEAGASLLERLDDETIALAIRAVRELEHVQPEVNPGSSRAHGSGLWA